VGTADRFVKGCRNADDASKVRAPSHSNERRLNSVEFADDSTAPRSDSEHEDDSGMRAFRRVIAGVALAAAALLLVAVAAPYLVDGRTVRDQLVVKLSAWAEGDLRVSGDVRLTSLFDLTIEAGDVRIDEPARFPDISAIEADQVAARLNIWDLLNGRIVFDKVWVAQPVFTLQRPWPELAPERLWRGVLLDEWSGFARLIETMQTAPFRYIAFNDARLEPAPVLDRTSLSKGPLTVVLNRQSSPDSVHVDARIGPPEQSTRITLARSVFQPAGPTLEAPVSLTVESADLGWLSLDGSIIRANGTRLIGNLDFRDASLTALAGWLDLPTGDALAERRYSATAALEATREKLSLQQLDVELGDTQVTGLLNLALDQDKPKLSGTLGMSAVDLRGLSLTGQADGVFLPEDPRSVRRGGPWPRAQRIGNWLNSFTADLRLSAESLTFDALTTGETAAFLSVGRGTATLNVAELMVFDGMMNGQFSVRWQQDGFHVSGKGKATGIALQPLLANMQAPQLASGTADISFAVDGEGPTMAAATRDADLNGQLMALQGGELALDVAAIASRARQRAVEGEGTVGSRLAPGSADYDMLRASFRVNRRELRLAPLEVVQNGWIIRGGGRADLLQQRLDWRLDAARAPDWPAAQAGMSETGGASVSSSEAISLHVTGTLQRPWISYKMPELPLSSVDGSHSWWR